jgi:hypothetical protein
MFWQNGLSARLLLQQILRFLIPAGLSALSAMVGSLACAFLYVQTTTVGACFWAAAALVGLTSALFFFFRFLQQISHKPKQPFIPTLPH